MFEINGDIDLNDDIFDNIARSSQIPNRPKRKSETEPHDPKRLRLPPEPQPLKTKQLLEKITNKTFNSPLYTSEQFANRKVVPRKFPGPAGLLSDASDLNTPGAKPSGHTNEEILCSQMSVSSFTSEPWLRMLDDFGVSVGGARLPDKYTIRWIKSRSSAKKLVDQKAPFLAAVVQNVENTKEKASTVALLLKDVTGEIEGTIQQELYEEYAKELVAGSVVVLRQFSVLTTNFGKSHYLTITPNNLVAFYSELRGSKWKNVSVYKVHGVTVEDLYEAIEDVAKKSRLQGSKSCVPFGTSEQNVVVLRERQITTSCGINNDLNIGSSAQKAVEIEPKFNFKTQKPTNTFENTSESEIKINNSQITIKSQCHEHVDILQDVLGGLDADSLFDEDF